MQTDETQVHSILTRSSGFLKTVCSHSLQPYRGCPFGASLCGVGCYVRHSGHITRGRPWVRVKIAASLDGRTALSSGASQWITGDAARADGHHWRARACASRCAWRRCEPSWVLGTCALHCASGVTCPAS